MSSQYHFENYCLFLFCHSYIDIHIVICPLLLRFFASLCLGLSPSLFVPAIRLSVCLWLCQFLIMAVFLCTTLCSHIHYFCFSYLFCLFFCLSTFVSLPLSVFLSILPFVISCSLHLFKSFYFLQKHSSGSASKPAGILRCLYFSL